MGNNVIHVSKDEAANDFAALLERVSEGAEVIIENDSRAVAVLPGAPGSRAYFAN